jgi:uncharacterized protein YfaS (alpha-2-macroglobulin family)
VAWAVFQKGGVPEAQSTRTYLLRHSPQKIDDPYVLALICNALLAMNPRDDSVRPYLDKLESLKRASVDGRHVWWELPARRSTAFYGAGRSGNVEATALSILALLNAERDPAAVRSALTWLVEQRIPGGTWGTTQATILALKALLAGTGKPLSDSGHRVVEILLDDQLVERLDLAPDQAEVMKLVDFSSKLKTSEQKLELRSTCGAGFQMAFRYHVPGEKPAKDAEPFTIALKYDREKLTVNDTLTVTAKVTSRVPETAPMVMLELPVPAGFAVEHEDFDKLQKQQAIARYQLSPQQVIVYLDRLEPNQPLAVTYRLKPTMPATLTIPPARVYEYYDPGKSGRSSSAHVSVTR